MEDEKLKEYTAKISQIACQVTERNPGCNLNDVCSAMSYAFSLGMSYADNWMIRTLTTISMPLEDYNDDIFEKDSLWSMQN